MANKQTETAPEPPVPLCHHEIRGRSPRASSTGTIVAVPEGEHARAIGGSSLRAIEASRPYVADRQVRSASAPKNFWSIAVSRSTPTADANADTSTKVSASSGARRSTPKAS